MLSSYTVCIAATLYLIIDLGEGVVIQNGELLDIPAEDYYRLLPARVPGSMSSRQVEADTICPDCILKAKTVIDRFSQYKYWNYYDGNPNVTNSDQLSGIKTCSELGEVVQCLTECAAGVTAGNVTLLKNYREYKTALRLNELYCEARYTPGYSSCRLADTHRCDKIRRSSCGDKLAEYAECVNRTLLISGQDCNGDCTPARRFLKSQRFIWDMECALKATFKSQCKDIVTIFCFRQVKDSDVNYGIYQYMNTIPEMSNSLTNTCRILDSPFECMKTATEGFYDYFGLNVTYACRGAEATMNSIKQQWQTIIDPFCGAHVPAEHKTIADVCPIPDPANAPPEVPLLVTRAPTTTTQRTWEFYEPKKGKCPVTVGAPETCDAVCGDDSHCSGSLKCCTSCCREPLVRRGSPGGRLPRLPGGAQGPTNPAGVGPRGRARSKPYNSADRNGCSITMTLLVSAALLLSY